MGWMAKGASGWCRDDRGDGLGDNTRMPLHPPEFSSYKPVRVLITMLEPVHEPAADGIPIRRGILS